MIEWSWPVAWDGHFLKKQNVFLFWQKLVKTAHPARIFGVSDSKFLVNYKVECRPDAAGGPRLLSGRRHAGFTLND
jgi:hypothetical protein